MTTQADADMLMGSAHGPGFHICGISPRVPLTAVSEWDCYNCGAKLVRCFSGSGWYEDEALCAACGESSTGYRPFQRGWRKDNIKRAAGWLEVAVPYGEFSATTMRLIKAEMGWDNPAEHEFRTFRDDDACDMCEQPAEDHPMGSIPTSSKSSTGADDA